MSEHQSKKTPAQKSAQKNPANLPAKKARHGAPDYPVPAHVGIIMDGNGRWAKEHSLPRSRGHIAGIDAVKRTLPFCIRCGITHVTLFVFSTENWTRPKTEVSFILDLVAGKLKEHYPFYRANSIKVVHSGNRRSLSAKVRRELDAVAEDTKDNTALTLNLAFNYGGRDEIIRAAQRFIDAGHTHPLTEDELARYLDRPEIPFPDLIIRTGNRKRLSNFLLWQSAYAELYFSDVLWPDWNTRRMRAAINFYGAQKRNFGGLR